MKLLYAIYDFMWGDLITIPLPGGGSFGLSLLVLILVPAGIFFTLRTRFLPIRLFPEMIRVTLEKETSSEKEGISGFQALIVSTATRVGMGNLAGVVAAVSAGGAGAVFWMWVTALVGSATTSTTKPSARRCSRCLHGCSANGLSRRGRSLCLTICSGGNNSACI